MTGIAVRPAKAVRGETGVGALDTAFTPRDEGQAMLAHAQYIEVDQRSDVRAEIRDSISRHRDFYGANEPVCVFDEIRGIHRLANGGDIFAHVHLTTLPGVMITSAAGALFDLDPLHDASSQDEVRGLIATVGTEAEEEWLIAKTRQGSFAADLHGVIRERLEDVGHDTPNAVNTVVRGLVKDGIPGSSVEIRSLLYYRNSNYVESPATSFVEAVMRARLEA